MMQDRGMLLSERDTSPSKPTSVDVSKLKPNMKPMGNICHGCLIPSNSRGQHLFRNPGAAASSCLPCFAPPLHKRHRSRAVSKFKQPTATRNVPDTMPLTMPPMRLRSCVRSCTKPLVVTMSAHMIATTVECPKAKKKPTVVGRRSPTVSRRVTLSMAAIWSASTACRRPRAYDSNAAVPRPGAITRTEQKEKPVRHKIVTTNIRARLQKSAVHAA
mmetsp:Transcript_60148/g.173509  ORF Transcript_60148/g.173509 Transcript_60148/m.173509 type:complete len:216 (-) Transcript_60148:85-732(-)